MDPNGKIALVTGAGVRVGRAIALALAKGGADVAIHYGRSSEPAQQVAREIRALGRRAELFSADLNDAAQIQQLIEQVGRAFGRLDILVNNASVYEATPIDTLTAEQWDQQFAINVRAPALCVHHALPLMTAGGAIVNITDINAERGRANYVAYSASKGALLTLTKTLARALAGRNIRVNSVAPGVAAWPPTATEEQKARILAQIPMGRAGTPEDIASGVVFLVGNDYITGQNLRIDGGWLIA